MQRRSRSRSRPSTADFNTDSYPNCNPSDSSKDAVVAPSTKSITAVTKVMLTKPNENALRAALTVAVSIEADQTMFASSKSGVLKASARCGTKLYHAVLAVGFGTESDGTKYWRIKVACALRMVL